MAKYRVMTWKTIPAQVKAEDESGARVSRELPQWFAQEIDRVAMRDGLAGSEAYMEHWAWSKPQVRDGSAEDVVAAVIAELCAQWGRPVED